MNHDFGVDDPYGHPAVLSVGEGVRGVHRQGELAATVALVGCGTPMLLLRVGEDAVVGLDVFLAHSLRYLMDYLLPQLDSLVDADLSGEGSGCHG
ncbi:MULTISPECIES: hypothetical protein [unclassified Nocardia]|uniref:hypothetical protein n=1 Tax=unclassified Nocardia TaxID=2637762 RepID=UPI001CE45DF4|nr:MULTISPECIES: hypothetical protein [unclassified Nocardia]